MKPITFILLVPAFVLALVANITWDDTYFYIGIVVFCVAGLTDVWKGEKKYEKDC